jgi:hypothetical protein
VEGGYCHIYIGLTLEMRVVLGFGKDCSVLQNIGTAFSNDAAKPLRPKVNKCQGLALQCGLFLMEPFVRIKEREESIEKSLSACVRYMCACVYVRVHVCMHEDKDICVSVYLCCLACSFNYRMYICFL